MKPIRIVALALLGLAAVALAGVGRPEPAESQAGDARRGITVNATGKVTAVPDTAELSLGVETQAGTAREALAQNSDRVRRVIDAVRDAGVSKDDLQTSQVSMWPQRSSDGTTVTGYVATNSISVEVDNLAKAGDVVDAAVAAGANLAWGPTLSVEDREARYSEALAKAVEAARVKAETLADAAGVEVGRVTALVEGGSALEPPIYFGRGEAVAMDAAAPTPIEPGTQDIEATVTVTFAIG